MGLFRYQAPNTCPSNPSSGLPPSTSSRSPYGAFPSRTSELYSSFLPSLSIKSLERPRDPKCLANTRTRPDHAWNDESRCDGSVIVLFVRAEEHRLIAGLILWIVLSSCFDAIVVSEIKAEVWWGLIMQRS